MPKYPATFVAVVETVSDIDPPSSDELVCDWGNPQACTKDNTQRACFAGVALKAYVGRVGEDELDANFSDLLGDLMHLADALGLDFDEMVERGRNHYTCELEGRF